MPPLARGDVISDSAPLDVWHMTPSCAWPSATVSNDSRPHATARWSSALARTHNLINDWCDANHVRWRVYSNGFPFLAIVRPATFLFEQAKFRNFDDFAKDFQTESDAEFPQVIFGEMLFARIACPAAASFVHVASTLPLPIGRLSIGRLGDEWNVHGEDAALARQVANLNHSADRFGAASTDTKP